jgi:Domain of unknown function (DUF4136)
MNSRINLAAPMLIAMFLSVLAASAQKIEYQSAPGTNFSQYKTYRWQRAKDAAYPEKAIDEIFVRAIDSELSKKGFVRTENDEADLIVIYQIAILNDMEWSAGHSTIPLLGEVGTRGLVGGPVGGTNVIQKGSFILDLYDGKKRNQIWQAHATKTLDNTPDLGKKDRNIAKAMSKIFKNFPGKGN